MSQVKDRADEEQLEGSAGLLPLEAEEVTTYKIINR